MTGFFSSDSEPHAGWVPWLAGAVPLGYYVAGASGYAGLGEEGAFVAAARQFDVTYPPGAPISVLLSAPLALLPIGPLSFRVAVASALLAALTLGLFARALLWTLPQAGVRDARLCRALALSASLWLGQTPLFVQQALRPQLFALQFALTMLVFEVLLRFEAEQPSSSMRTLYFGAFVQGLCFANHHVYALLMLPVAAPTLGRVFAYRGFMGLMGHVAAPLVGFSAYVYVPSRLASGHGAPSEGGGLARLALMLGEEPYWGPSWASPPAVLETLRDGLLGPSTPALIGALLLCALGFATLLRSSSRRRFGLIWLIGLVLPLASVSLMLQPKLREDAWGALLPCAFALVASAACAAGMLFERLAQLAPRLGRLIGPALVALALLALMWRAPAAARPQLADAFDQLTRRALPARTVLLQHDAASTFRYQGGEAEEGALRADVTLVPLAYRSFPRLLDASARAHPELAPSLRELTHSGHLEAASLQALSAQRPVCVELSEQLPPALYVASVEEGLWARVLPRDTLVSDTRTARALQAAQLRRLYAGTPALRRVPHGAALQLGHTHLLQAVRRAGLGDRRGARDYLMLAEALGYLDPRVARLRQALEQKPAIDIASYLRLAE